MKLLRMIAQMIAQIALLWGFSLLGSLIAHLVHVHIPGSLIGLVIVFLLLQFGVMKLSWVELGATWLIADLLLFYVPPAVGIVEYGHLLRMDGLRIVVVIGLSTVIVMATTGFVADRLQWLRRIRAVRRRKAKRDESTILSKRSAL